MAGSSRSGRRQLVPAPGFGRAVYDRMRQMRNQNGTTWDVADLAREAGVSGTTVRQWIKGAIPKGLALAKLADVLSVEPSALLEGQINPINQPAEPRTGTYAATGADGARASDSASARVAEGHIGLSLSISGAGTVHPMGEPARQILERRIEHAMLQGDPVPLSEVGYWLKLVRAAATLVSAGEAVAGAAEQIQADQEERDRNQSPPPDQRDRGAG